MGGGLYQCSVDDLRNMLIKNTGNFYAESDDAINFINERTNKIGIRFMYGNTRLGFFGYQPAQNSLGEIRLYNQASNCYIAVRDNGDFVYRRGSTILNIETEINNLKSKISALETKLNSLTS